VCVCVCVNNIILTLAYLLVVLDKLQSMFFFTAACLCNLKFPEWSEFRVLSSVPMGGEEKCT
jgi:hypothetical protein